MNAAKPKVPPPTGPAPDLPQAEAPLPPPPQQPPGQWTTPTPTPSQPARSSTAPLTKAAGGGQMPGSFPMPCLHVQAQAPNLSAQQTPRAFNSELAHNLGRQQWPPQVTWLLSSGKASPTLCRLLWPNRCICSQCSNTCERHWSRVCYVGLPCCLSLLVLVSVSHCVPSVHYFRGYGILL